MDLTVEGQTTAALSITTWTAPSTNSTPLSSLPGFRLSEFDQTRRLRTGYTHFKKKKNLSRGFLCAFFIRNHLYLFKKTTINRSKSIEMNLSNPGE
jgi:hypothetical protein